MKAKRLLALFAVPMLLGTVASCGEATTTVKPDTKPTVPTSVIPQDVIVGTKEKPVKIMFWHTMGKDLQNLVKEYIESFKAVQPYVVVEEFMKNSSYSGLKDAVAQAFTSGTAPDMVEAYPDHVADYLDYGYGQDLTDFMAKYPLEDADDMVGLEEGTQYLTPGMYSLPWKKSSEVLIYNEVLVGLDLSRIDSTINGGRALSTNYLDHLNWEELFDKLAPALQTYNAGLAADKKIYDTTGDNAVVGYDSDDNLFITLAKQYGYGYTSIDETGEPSIDFNKDSNMKNLVKKFGGYAAKGLLTTKGLLAGAFTSTFFTARKCLFTISSSAGIKYAFDSENPFKANVGCLPQPAVLQNNKKNVISQGGSFTILSNQKDQSKEARDRALASYLFYRHLTNVENATDWVIRGQYDAIRKSTFNDEGYIAAKGVEGKPNPSGELLLALYATKVAKEYADNNYYFTSPAFKGSSTARVQVGGIITEAFTGYIKATDQNPFTDIKLDEIFSKAFANITKAL
ncbi:MAG: extracellular solute-binding protein [Bacilli bacterium]